MNCTYCTIFLLTEHCVGIGLITLQSILGPDQDGRGTNPVGALPPGENSHLIASQRRPGRGFRDLAKSVPICRPGQPLQVGLVNIRAWGLTRVFTQTWVYNLRLDTTLADNPAGTT